MLSTVTVDGDTVKVHADNLPKLSHRARPSPGSGRSPTSSRRIDQLPGGMKLDRVQAAKDGVDITVKGSNVGLAG